MYFHWLELANNHFPLFASIRPIAILLIEDEFRIERTAMDVLRRAGKKSKFLGKSENISRQNTHDVFLQYGYENLWYKLIFLKQ